LQEDVDIVGLSILSGAHNALVPAVLEQLRENGLADVKVFIGGIIPESDIPGLIEKGVYAVYGPGTDTQTIASEIARAIHPQSE